MKRKRITRAHDPRLATLADMLTYCRPADSASEADFIRRYILPLPGVWMDDCGNYHVIVGEAPAIVWSCHTDTVHKTDGRQRLWITPHAIGLHPHEKTNCLGADDTVGVWIACELIRANVSGHYVFHYAEEIGGIGSRAIVNECPELFEGARFCIALDRQGTTDVITHQAGGRCCSDAFAASLASQLQSVAPYKASDRGVYTDSAEYIGIIGECTNLSVGYYRQHSANEYVDTTHALALLDALMRLDPDALASERAPGFEPDPFGDDWDDDDWHWSARESTRADVDKPWLAWGMSRDDWDAMSDDDRRFANYLMTGEN
jgi:hypothetical protein